MYLVHSFLALGVVVVTASRSTLNPYSLEGLQEPLDASRLVPSLPVLSEISGSENKTIYEVLRDNKEYSKLTKVINFVDDIIDILNGTASDITFFATPDEALRCPRHDKDKATGEDDLITSKLPDLCDAHHATENLESLEQGDGKRKKFLKKIIRAVLLYHILPSKLNSVALSNNNTFATKLILPNPLDQRPLRIRVIKGFIAPITVINLHSKVIRPNIPAANGLIHNINHPIVPPPSVLEELFDAPSMFSTFTSAIQRAGLTDYLDIRFVRKSAEDHGTESFDFKGSPAVTVFAPTNAAFRKLPWKLRRFLFSPFGRRVLRKLLEYHIVPDYIFHTDYHFNATSKSTTMFIQMGGVQTSTISHGQINEVHGESQSRDSWNDVQFPRKDSTDSPLTRTRPRPENHDAPAKNSYHEFSSSLGCRHSPRKPIFSYDMELPTAYENHTIHVHVEKVNITIPFPGPHKPSRTKTILAVNHRPAVFADVVGLNGAVHTIDTLLNPRGHHVIDTEGQGKSWQNWEDWLLEWADVN